VPAAPLPCWNEGTRAAGLHHPLMQQRGVVTRQQSQLSIQRGEKPARNAGRWHAPAPTGLRRCHGPAARGSWHPRVRPAPHSPGTADALPAAGPRKRRRRCVAPHPRPSAPATGKAGARSLARSPVLTLYLARNHRPFRSGRQLKRPDTYLACHKKGAAVIYRCPFPMHLLRLIRTLTDLIASLAVYPISAVGLKNWSWTIQFSLSSM